MVDLQRVPFSWGNIQMPMCRSVGRFLFVVIVVVLVVVVVVFVVVVAVAT